MLCAVRSFSLQQAMQWNPHLWPHSSVAWYFVVPNPLCRQHCQVPSSRYHTAVPVQQAIHYKTVTSKEEKLAVYQERDKGWNMMKHDERRKSLFNWSIDPISSKSVEVLDLGDHNAGRNSWSIMHIGPTSGLDPRDMHVLFNFSRVWPCGSTISSARFVESKRDVDLIVESCWVLDGQVGKLRWRLVQRCHVPETQLDDCHSARISTRVEAHLVGVGTSASCEWHARNIKQKCCNVSQVIAWCEKICKVTLELWRYISATSVAEMQRLSLQNQQFTEILISRQLG